MENSDQVETVTVNPMELTVGELESFYCYNLTIKTHEGKELNDVYFSRFSSVKGNNGLSITIGVFCNINSEDPLRNKEHTFSLRDITISYQQPF